jgi:general L-amino acid transport system permease protein
VDVFFAILAIGIVWLLWLEAPRRDLGALYFFVVVPVVSYVLLNGWELIGLRQVDTSLWGGVLVTIVVSWVGIVFSLPIGILLALGRRSTMPAVKLFSVIFIEFVRGVPLITVLFMASLMIPLFLPEGITIDKLLRAQIAFILFAAAYEAEVVRGGLQAIAKGQFEAADALGLSYWQKTGFIILPQALKLVIPPMVNTFIGFFKDTSLVIIIGMFDLLGATRLASSDPVWRPYYVEGLVFVALIYFAFCFTMAEYSRSVERRLNTGRR